MNSHHTEVKTELVGDPDDIDGIPIEPEVIFNEALKLDLRVPANIEKKREYLTLIADSKPHYAAAQHHLGYMYYYGWLGKGKLEEAIKYFALAAEQNYPKSSYYLVECFESKDSIPYLSEAKRYGENMIKKVDKMGLYLLRIYHARNLGFDGDLDEGLLISSLINNELLAQARVSNFSQLQSCLGEFYEKRGSIKNLRIAEELYSLAVKQGLVEAKYQLGNLYQWKMQDSLQEAIELYHSAALQGNANAQNALGDCYQYGHGVSIDLKKAMLYYQEAANKDHLLAQCKLKALKDNLEKKPKEMAFPATASRSFIPSALLSHLPKSSRPASALDEEKRLLILVENINKLNQDQYKEIIKILHTLLPDQQQSIHSFMKRILQKTLEKGFAEASLHVLFQASFLKLPQKILQEVFPQASLQALWQSLLPVSSQASLQVPSLQTLQTSQHQASLPLVSPSQVLSQGSPQALPVSYQNPNNFFSQPTAPVSPVSKIGNKRKSPDDLSPEDEQCSWMKLDFDSLQPAPLEQHIEEIERNFLPGKNDEENLIRIRQQGKSL